MHAVTFNTPRGGAFSFFCPSTPARLMSLLVTVTLLLLSMSSSCAAVGDFVDSSHLAWTAIPQSSRNEVDMWTKSSSGCACPPSESVMAGAATAGTKGANKNSKTCACCTNQGACQCGIKAPNRCAQCGLQEHCDQMCNVTVASAELFTKSKLRYGMIKSMEMHERHHCWYRFIPEPGYRIEIQVYRLMDMGQLNRSKCEGGRLEWMANGGRPSASGIDQTTANQQAQHLWTLCGANERYSPPALFFSDDDISPATLYLKAGESTRRGKLLAHFSFTPIDHQSQLGLQLVGGTPAHGAACDWHYQQSDCVTGARYNNTCRMASPGYPGLYPPGRACRYHVVLKSPFQPLTLQFVSVQLPPQRCRTDNIRIYVNGRLHTTLCGQETTQITTHGPDVTVEFNSGMLVLPYVFNGFYAKLVFGPPEDQVQPQQQHGRGLPFNPSPSVFSDISKGAFRTVERQAHAVCDYIVRPNATRIGARSTGVHWSGFFSTASTAWKVWPAPCSFNFPIQPGQSVQISLLTYNLTGNDCASFVEVYEGSLDVRWSSSEPKVKICSPEWKKSRNSYSKFNPPLLIQSNNASLSLRFKLDPTAGLDQLVEGAFAYHDEFGGERKAGTLCDALYNDRVVPAAGRFGHSFDSTVFWSVAGPFNCSASFEPRNGQTVTLTVAAAERKDDDPKCRSECDRHGCQCHTNQSSIHSVDRITVSLMGTNRSVVCLCGNMQPFLPLSLSSNAHISVRQYVADFRFGQPNLKVDFSYSFSEDQRHCAPANLSSSSGSLVSPHFGKSDKTFHDRYHHTDCLWVATAKPAEQWMATVYPPHQGGCENWNVTFHYYDESSTNKLGQLIHLICPDVEKQIIFAMPVGIDSMAIRLQAWDTAPVEYRIDWKTSSSSPIQTAPAGVQRSLSALISTPAPSTETTVAVVPNLTSGTAYHVSCTLLYLLAVPVIGRT